MNLRIILWPTQIRHRKAVDRGIYLQNKSKTVLLTYCFSALKKTAVDYADVEKNTRSWPNGTQRIRKDDEMRGPIQSTPNAAGSSNGNVPENREQIQ